MTHRERLRWRQAERDCRFDAPDADAAALLAGLSLVAIPVLLTWAAINLPFPYDTADGLRTLPGQTVGESLCQAGAVYLFLLAGLLRDHLCRRREG